MAVTTTDTGNIFSSGSIDPASLLLGGNVLGNNNDFGGSGFVLGALLGRTLFNNGLDGDRRFDGQNADRAAIDAAVAAALARANQDNNNAMLLLKDIQDSSQEVISTVTTGNQNIVTAIDSASQSNLIQSLQNQISTLGAINNSTQVTGNALDNVANQISGVTLSVAQGQADINNNIAEAKFATAIGQAETNAKVAESQFALAQTIRDDGDKTRALITQNMITELNNQIADLRTARHVTDSGLTVTNNINQTQQQQQQQQQIWNINNLLQDLLAQQKITQGIINVGGTVAGASQTAANTRVNS